MTTLGLLAATALLLTPAPTADPTPTACPSGAPHYDFTGMNINMRSTPGGNYVGSANQGDCALWYQTDPGPTVQCPDGTPSIGWLLVQNKRTRVVGYVSSCYLA